MAKKDFKQVVTTKNRVWYMENVDISYSWESLENVAKSLGANVDKGDILVVDNENKDKRKVFRKMGDGRAAILYLRTPRKSVFLSLHEKGKGLVGLDTMVGQGLFE